MKKSNLRAFSLVEISMVLLIIGILIAGITEGANLIRKSRLRVAQSLTKSSPVISTKGLMLWYETSLETSFNENEINNDDQVTPSISVWYDNNSQLPAKNNAIQSTSANKPLFITDTFNGGIPAVRFDGTDDFMTFSGDALIGTGYTIFIVEQRRSSGVMALIGGTTESTNLNLHIGYRTDSTFIFDQGSNGIEYTIPSYTSPIPRIHTCSLNTSTGRKYYLNGGSTPEVSVSNTSTLISYNGSAIGRLFAAGAKYYNGDIAEIIIFTRSLAYQERQAIENYLSKKYGIAIS